MEIEWFGEEGEGEGEGEEEEEMMMMNGCSSTSASASASSSSLLWLMGSRQRFNIELRPGETTIVSWKRLVKDAAAADVTNANSNAIAIAIAIANANPNNSTSSSSSQPPPPPPLNTSSSAPNSHQDHHFQDANLTTTSRHNGSIIDNGSVENIELISSPDHKLKKRRKSTPKVIDNTQDNLSNKHVKLDLNTEDNTDVKLELPIHSQPSIAFSEKERAHIGVKLEYSSCFEGIPNMDASAFSNSNDSENQGTGNITCGIETGNDVNLATELDCDTHKNYEDESGHLEPQSQRLMEEIGGLEIYSNASMREKSGSTELPDLNIPVEPTPLQPMKSVSMTSKDPSGLRPKCTMLEKAFRELELVVAELRPSNMDLNNFDNSSTAMKKRLPAEVKLKLAKVARLAQSSQGTISEEIIKHLMSILGHLVQLRTLKRNLRDMVLQGLSAKREKADKFQQIKKEVIEMIKLQGFMQGCASSIFTESMGTEQKPPFMEKIVMDNAMEDKICDLYDLYVQGMDEDKGPQIRKLYIELVELWPNGVMNKHQVKDAIRRAKERRRAFYDHQKASENVRKKKLAPRKDNAHEEGSSVRLPEADLQSQRVVTESNSHELYASSDKMSLSPPTNHYLSFVDPSIKMEVDEEITMPVLRRQGGLESNTNKLS
ncbi:hypothetical protein ACFE04_019127 [Oxalis oulophora]